MRKSQLRQVIKEELAKRQTLNEDLDAIITKFIETDDATELKAYLRSLPDRARVKLAKIFKIDLNEDGYENIGGKLVPHNDTFDSTKLSKILYRIATERPEENEEPVFKENVFSPNYITNLRPKGSFNDLVNVDVYKDEKQGYTLGLSVYTVTGTGMSQVHRLKFADRAIPMDEFTSDYVVERVGTVYILNDKNKQELRDFVNNIPTKLG